MAFGEICEGYSQMIALLITITTVGISGSLATWFSRFFIKQNPPAGNFEPLVSGRTLGEGGG